MCGRTRRSAPTRNSSNQASRPISITIQRHIAMQGGMWNGRASRRTRVSESKHRDKSSAGIGTTVEHPPCERMPDSKPPTCAGGHSGPPLHRNFPTAEQPEISKSNKQTSFFTTTPTRAGGHGGPPLRRDFGFPAPSPTGSAHPK